MLMRLSNIIGLILLLISITTLTSCSYAPVSKKPNFDQMFAKGKVNFNSEIEKINEIYKQRSAISLVDQDSTDATLASDLLDTEDELLNTEKVATRAPASIETIEKETVIIKNEDQGLTPIEQLIKQGKVDQVTDYFKKAKEGNSLNPDELESSLAYALKKGKTDVAEALIKLGANPKKMHFEVLP